MNTSRPDRQKNRGGEEEEGMLLNDMSRDLQRAFLLRLHLERVVVRTLSWKVRSMAFLGVAVGLLSVSLKFLSQPVASQRTG